MPEGYTVGKWAGHDNYECDSCPLKTLDLATMEAHLRNYHQPPPPPPYAPAAGPTVKAAPAAARSRATRKSSLTSKED